MPKRLKFRKIQSIISYDTLNFTEFRSHRVMIHNTVRFRRRTQKNGTFMLYLSEQAEIFSYRSQVPYNIFSTI